MLRVLPFLALLAAMLLHALPAVAAPPVAPGSQGPGTKAAGPTSTGPTRSAQPPAPTPKAEQAQSAQPFAPTPTPAPVPVVEDGFDRPDATTLGTAPTGQAWRTDGSTWGICGGRGCMLGPAGGYNYARIQTGLVDQWVSLTVQPRPSSAVGEAAIISVVTDDWASHLRYVGFFADGRVELWTLVGGAWSAAPVASASTPFDGSVVRTLQVRFVGSTANVVIDGNPVLAYDALPAAPAGATYAGMAGHAAGPQSDWPVFDDFWVAAP